ncbi:MAG: putative sugar O-methyltransferase [Treponema sp.]|nr:putative sugar O-methyltransferase [Treponema sp.]
MRKIVKGMMPYAIVRIYQNRKRGNIVPVKLKTSVSDNGKYPDFCLKASNDVLIFSNFRQNSIYREILEHVTPQLGREYLAAINDCRPGLLKDIEKIKENDIYGNPDLVEYESTGKICPSTLRYTKVLADLLNLFDSLDKLNIVEIGVGYGGQCRVINSITSPKEYTLVDIKPALLLSQCYLDGFVLPSVMKYKTMNELKKNQYDLVISNYAFTELPRKIQDVYLDKIILNSNCGYITYNDISPEYFQSYKKDELLKLIPNSFIINEVPLTSEKNCIITWKNNRF